MELPAQVGVIRIAQLFGIQRQPVKFRMRVKTGLFELQWQFTDQ